MAQAPETLTPLVRAALGRGRGEAGVQMAGGGQLPVLPQPGLPVALDDAGPAEPALDPGILDVLAEKVLLAWLCNRYQLLFPFAFDLRRIDKDQTELLVQAMVAAARVDGAFDAKERERIEGVMSLLGPDEEASLAAALDRPKPLHEILGQVRDVQTGGRVYAVSLMAVDQRKAVNRCYLRYLAARLQLSEELVGSLEQRFRSAG